LTTTKGDFTIGGWPLNVSGNMVSVTKGSLKRKEEGSGG
jgi:hypothetical protein